MTPRQLEVLQFVEDYSSKNGCTPTLQEIADRLKVTKVTVLSHLRKLEKSRHLKRGYYRRRGIEVLAPTRRLRITGRIAPGRPVERLADEPELDLSGFVGNGRDCYALEVRGDMMLADQIKDGDYVIVERRETGRVGETVVAELPAGEMELGRCGREGGGLCVRRLGASAGSGLLEGAKIQGVVVGVFRRM